MKTSKIIITLSLLLSMASNINAQTQWSCNPYDYEYDMAIYFSLLFNEETEVDMSNFELAAFCKEECRGVGDIQTIPLSDGSTASFGYIRIYSNSIEGDTIYFRVFDKVLREERDVEDTLLFQNQELIGLPSSPKVIVFYDERPVTVTAKSYSRIYGKENPVFEYVAEGFELKGVPEITCEANASSPVGEYPIIVSRGTVKNKKATFVNGMLTITKATVGLTWGETSFDCDGTEKQPTVEATGLLEGDDCTVTVEGSGIAVGSYTATATALSNSNYQLPTEGTSCPFVILRDMAGVFSSGCQWATYVAQEDLQTPVGLEAYSVSDVTQESVTGTAIAYIPAGVGVLLQRSDLSADSYKGEAYTGTKENIASKLVGHATATTEMKPFKDFVLYRDEFVLSSTNTAAAGHAYLPAANVPSNARSLSICIDENVTAINSLKANGRIGTWYDMVGRRLDKEPTTKGFYINNGKKVIIK